MPNVIATQEDPNNPGGDDWRPDTSKDLSREKADFLSTWGKEGSNDEKKTAKGKGKAAPVVEDDDDLEDRDDDDLDGDDDDDDDEETDAVESAPAKKRKPVVEDDDEDEEEVDADDDEEEEDEEKDEDEDPDADLDDDEKPEKDPKVAKGMAALQRQEKRMREAIDRERETVRSELAQGRQKLESLQSEIDKSKAKYEGLADRAKLDPLGVLEELGVDDDEFVGRQAHARLKSKTDPAYREAAARMKADRTTRAELDALKAKDAARDKEAADAKKQAEQRADFDKFVGGVTKEAKAFPKATLTNRLLKNDPDEARGLFARAAHALWTRDGAEPGPRAVVKHAEKMKREELRKLGIDPRTLGAAVESEKSSAISSGARTNGKPVKGKAKTSLDAELKRPSRDELINEDWTSGTRTR